MPNAWRLAFLQCYTRKPSGQRRKNPPIGLLHFPWLGKCINPIGASSHSSPVQALQYSAIVVQYYLSAMFLCSELAQLELGEEGPAEERPLGSSPDEDINDDGPLQPTPGNRDQGILKLKPNRLQNRAKHGYFELNGR